MKRIRKKIATDTKKLCFFHEFRFKELSSFPFHLLTFVLSVYEGWNDMLFLSHFKHNFMNFLTTVRIVNLLKFVRHILFSCHLSDSWFTVFFLAFRLPGADTYSVDNEYVDNIEQNCMNYIKRTWWSLEKLIKSRRKTPKLSIGSIYGTLIKMQ